MNYHNKVLYCYCFVVVVGSHSQHRPLVVVVVQFILILNKHLEKKKITHTAGVTDPHITIDGYTPSIAIKYLHFLLHKHIKMTTFKVVKCYLSFVLCFVIFIYLFILFTGFSTL